MPNYFLIKSAFLSHPFIMSLAIFPIIFWFVVILFFLSRSLKIWTRKDNNNLELKDTFSIGIFIVFLITLFFPISLSCSWPEQIGLKSEFLKELAPNIYTAKIKKIKDNPLTPLQNFQRNHGAWRKHQPDADYIQFKNKLLGLQAKDKNIPFSDSDVAPLFNHAFFNCMKYNKKLEREDNSLRDIEEQMKIQQYTCLRTAADNVVKKLSKK